LTTPNPQTLAEGLDRPYGVTLAPNGCVIVAEAGRGRVLAIKSGIVEEIGSGLGQPMGVVIAADGACLVSEGAAGRVTKLADGRKETVMDGLTTPQGMALQDNRLFVLDAFTEELIAFDMSSAARRTIASNLPVGAPPGVIPKPLRAIPPHSGPMGPFADLASGANGTLYVSGDAEGSVLALKRV
jgi:glucose/arabinose dehydrogenase